MSVSAEVATLFLEELAAHNLSATLDEEGQYLVQSGDWKMTVSLENLSRDYERDLDPDRVRHFVATLVSQLGLPDWEQARSRIRWSAEPADIQALESISQQVSEEVLLILVYVDPTETQIIWLNSGLIGAWEKSVEELWAIAAVNMSRILQELTIQVEVIDGHKLGMLSTDLVAFKAALLFSPNLKEVVEPVLGWPVLAVLPCRDFVYLLSQKNSDLMPRLGTVVGREHSQGGYPITTEVLQIDDEGASVIGKFQKAPEEQSESEEEEMKTIHYRGGLVSFRIPSYWEEEYEEKGGGTFYDEECETGTLRLNTMLLQSKAPVTIHTGREVLTGREAPGKSEPRDLGNGNWMITYRQETEEDGEPITIQYWEIANVMPPSHLRIILFSYSVGSFAIEDEEIREQLAMLSHEIPRSHFAEEVGA